MFRDEKAAAMARAEAAERRLQEMEQDQEAEEAELAELRAQLEEQRAEIERLRKAAGEAESRRERAKERKKRAKEAKRRAKEAQGKRSLRQWAKDNPVAVYLGGSLLVGVLVAVGVIVYHYAAAWRAAAELHQAHVARLAGGGEALLIVGAVRHEDEHGDSYTYRIDVVDPRSGQRLAREVPDHMPWVLPGVPGRFWCLVEGGKRLQVRELTALSVEVSFEELARRNPALSAGLHRGVEVDLWRGGAIVTTKSGDRLLIDGKTLKARPFSSNEETVSAPSGGGTVMVAALKQAKILQAGQIKRSDGEFYVEDKHRLTHRQHAALADLPRIEDIKHVFGSRERTTSGTGTEQGALTFEKLGDGPKQALHLKRAFNKPREALGPATTYLEPELIKRHTSDSALALPGGAGFLVKHQESLDSGQSGLLLSRVTPAGKRAWTVKDVNGDVFLGYLAGDLVVVAVKANGEKPGYVLGISWMDGAIRWRYEV